LNWQSSENSAKFEKKKTMVKPFSPISSSVIEGNLIDASALISPQANENAPLKKNQVLPDMTDRSALASVTQRGLNKDDDPTLLLTLSKTTRLSKDQSALNSKSILQNKEEDRIPSSKTEVKHDESNLSVIRDNSDVVKMKGYDFESQVFNDEQSLFSNCIPESKKKRFSTLKLQINQALFQSSSSGGDKVPDSNYQTFRSEDSLKTSTEISPNPPELTSKPSTETLKPSPMRPGNRKLSYLMRSNSIESPTRTKNPSILKLKLDKEGENPLIVNLEAHKGTAFKKPLTLSRESSVPANMRNHRVSDRRRDLYRKAVLKKNTVTTGKMMDKQFNFSLKDDDGLMTPQPGEGEKSFFGNVFAGIPEGGESNRSSDRGDVKWQSSNTLGEKDDEPFVLDLENENLKTPSLSSIPSTRRGIIENLAMKRKLQEGSRFKDGSLVNSKIFNEKDDEPLVPDFDSNSPSLSSFSTKKEILENLALRRKLKEASKFKDESPVHSNIISEKEDEPLVSDLENIDSKDSSLSSLPIRKGIINDLAMRRKNRDTSRFKDESPMESNIDSEKNFEDFIQEI